VTSISMQTSRRPGPDAPAFSPCMTPGVAEKFARSE
jgi:hypothetical protein